MNPSKQNLSRPLKTRFSEYYSENPKQSESYSRIVNKKHFERLVSGIENAVDNNVNIEFGGDHDATSNYIAPTLISNISEEAILMKEEIFGPILPLKTYKTIDEAIDYINSGEKPLALYIYTKNKKVRNTIIKNTRAGSTCVNTNALQYSNHNLPFGGSNNSGIGKAHGFFGFQEFSNARSVLKRHSIGPFYLLFPPYSSIKERIAKLTVKWF